MNLLRLTENIYRLDDSDDNRQIIIKTISEVMKKEYNMKNKLAKLNYSWIKGFKLINRDGLENV